MKKLLLVSVFSLTISTAAHAQFGGLAPKLPGVGGGGSSSSSVSGDQVDKFLIKTANATRFIAASMFILEQASKEHGSVGAAKAQVDATAKAQNIKEQGALTETLKSSAKTLADNKNIVENFKANYAAANAKEKAAMAAAIYNFALFVPQLIEMPKNVSELISGIGSNPALLGKVGQLKTAGTLIGIQVQGTATVFKVLPQLMSVAKVKAPANAKSDTGQNVDI